LGNKESICIVLATYRQLLIGFFLDDHPIIPMPQPHQVCCLIQAVQHMVSCTLCLGPHGANQEESLGTLANHAANNLRT
jgi:hypothetical protein